MKISKLTKKKKYVSENKNTKEMMDKKSLFAELYSFFLLI